MIPGTSNIARILLFYAVGAHTDNPDTRNMTKTHLNLKNKVMRKKILTVMEPNMIHFITHAKFTARL